MDIVKIGILLGLVLTPLIGMYSSVALFFAVPEKIARAVAVINLILDATLFWLAIYTKAFENDSFFAPFLSVVILSFLATNGLMFFKAKNQILVVLAGFLSAIVFFMGAALLFWDLFE